MATGEGAADGGARETLSRYGNGDEYGLQFGPSRVEPVESAGVPKFPNNSKCKDVGVGK